MKFIERAFYLPKRLFHYSGLGFLYKKLNYFRNPPPLMTASIWITVIYVALFSFTLQRYENRVDIIENRAIAIFNQLPTHVYKKALGKISKVQNMPCPEKPKFLEPASIYRSLFKKTQYREQVILLRETIVDWKEKLDGVYLRKAYLNSANLREANFIEADLSKANLKKANLQEANFLVANLQGANLRKANLSSANLQEASIQEAKLEGANLQKANLKKAKLQGANLQEADLRKANLKKANLKGANLQNADLQKAKFHGASLQRVDFHGAILSEAILHEVNLVGARGLTAVNICKAKTIHNAKFDPLLNQQVIAKCPRLLEKLDVSKDETPKK